jgi:hypothetical protein
MDGWNECTHTHPHVRVYANCTCIPCSELNMQQTVMSGDSLFSPLVTPASQSFTNPIIQVQEHYLDFNLFPKPWSYLVDSPLVSLIHHLCSAVTLVTSQVPAV